eukprot:Skav218064  [mRNA]  locus=scaffold1832:46993:49865:+ [translate_table: standard]
MLSREGVPLHDEIPVFAELAAIRELAKKTLLGSADMRLWVVQKDPVVTQGTPMCHKHILSRASPTLRYRIKAAEAVQREAAGAQGRPLFEREGKERTPTVTWAEMKRFCSKSWWPVLALSKELQLPDIEAASGILQVLARHGGTCRLATLPILHGLHVDALTQLLCSEAWIVSIEAELFSLVQTWLKGQPWTKSSKSSNNDKNKQQKQPKDKDKDKVVAPPEVFAASAKWGIRWGHLHPPLLCCIWAMASR